MDLSSQFMSIGDVGKLKSANDFGMTADESYRARYNPQHPKQQEMDKSVAAEGIHKPLEVANGDTLHDGHHRYYSARAANHGQVPVKHVTFAVADSPQVSKYAHDLPGIEDALRNMKL